MNEQNEFDGPWFCIAFLAIGLIGNTWSDWAANYQLKKMEDRIEKIEKIVSPKAEKE